MPNTNANAPIPAPIFTSASTKHLSRQELLDILNESYYHSLKEETEQLPEEKTLLQILSYLKRITSNKRKTKRS